MRTQSDRLLVALHLNGDLCAVEPLRWSPPITRVAARIHDLRRRGYLIETAQCPEHRGESNHANYRLQGQVSKGLAL